MKALSSRIPSPRHSGGCLGAPPVPSPSSFETPRQAEHGDLTTNIAMIAREEAGKRPRAACRGDRRARGRVDRAFVSRVEIAGPGVHQPHVHRGSSTARGWGTSSERRRCGTDGRDRRQGQRVQVEFVSANPDGPASPWATAGERSTGTRVARLCEWTGHAVEREYYFNNAGRQMRILGDSVRLRYLELLGDPDGSSRTITTRENTSGRSPARLARGVPATRLRNEPAEGRFKAPGGGGDLRRHPEDARGRSG
ncbi:MAG: hypothetical protein MZV64_74230 [Ignavibacteriales bacterium]|nr:hypothetical protein [Ignavibacteriales bacterium]